MEDIQSIAFRWIGQQSLIAALVVAGTGLMFNLYGFRFGRFLMGLTAGAGGFVVGAIFGAVGGMPVEAVGGAFGLVFLAIGLWRYRVGIFISSVFVGAASANLLVSRFTGLPDSLAIATLMGGIAGGCLQWVCLKSLPIMITCVEGGFIMIVGFVGLAYWFAPSLAATYVNWSDSVPFMTPVMMIMLYVLGYSVQANAQQGDMRAGGSKQSHIADLVQ